MVQQERGKEQQTIYEKRRTVRKSKVRTWGRKRMATGEKTEDDLQAESSKERLRKWPSGNKASMTDEKRFNLRNEVRRLGQTNIISVPGFNMQGNK